MKGINFIRNIMYVCVGMLILTLISGCSRKADPLILEGAYLRFVPMEQDAPMNLNLQLLDEDATFEDFEFIIPHNSPSDSVNSFKIITAEWKGQPTDTIRPLPLLRFGDARDDVIMMDKEIPYYQTPMDLPPPLDRDKYFIKIDSSGNYTWVTKESICPCDCKTNKDNKNQ